MHAYIVLLALMTLSFVLTPAPRALAISDEEMCELRDALRSKLPTEEQELYTSDVLCRSNYWTLLKPKPLDEIMPPEERAALRRTAAAGDCEAATKLLARRFVEGHPDVPSILENAADYRAWKTRVARRAYDDTALCLHLKEIKSAQAEIDRLGLKAKPFTGTFTAPRKPITEPPGPEARRELAVSYLYNLLDSLHAQHHTFTNPELVKALLKLSYEGKALRLHPEYAYYLALWLRAAAEQDPVIEAILDRPIDPKHKARAQEAFKAGKILLLREFDR